MAGDTQDLGPVAGGNKLLSPLIVGVTGHRHLRPEDEPRIRVSLESIFRWIWGCPEAEPASLKLGAPPAMRQTPILLLSSLAPGADMLVVQAAQEVANDCEFGRAKLRVVSPLPFFHEQYLRSTTFEGFDAQQKAAHNAEFGSLLQDHFVVRLPEEVEFSAEDLRKRLEPCLTGPDCKDARRHRYRATGEYIATYSDILIAITDSVPPQERPKKKEKAAAEPVKSGANPIVEVKLNGLTPGMLPVMPVLNWADNGPVIHIYAHNANPNKAGESTSAGDKPGSQPPPAAPQVGDISIHYPYDARSDSKPAQVDGYEVLRTMAANLEELNSQMQPGGCSKLKEEFASMLPLPPSGSMDRNWVAKLERIACVRRRVADLNRRLEQRIRRLSAGFLWIAFIIALAMQLYENWEQDGLSFSRLSLFAIALFLLLGMFKAYEWFRTRRFEERKIDYRAIAEGLRVQFYWSVAGTGASVSSNYMQRERCEISWIRSVISAHSFPYEQDRLAFDQLPAREKLDLLKAVVKGWITQPVKGQLPFFQNNYWRYVADQDCLKGVGFSLIFTGLGIILVNLVDYALEGKAALQQLASVLGAIPFVYAAVFTMGLFIVPTVIRKLRELKWSLSFGFLWAFGLAMLFYADIPGMEDFPTEPKMLGIIKNLCMSAGGLLLGWVALRFMGENIRRYGSMAALFSAANGRLVGLLQKAEKEVDPVEKLNSKRKQGDKLTPDESKQLAEFDKTIRDIQDILVDLGKEALSENTEWIFMHRDRQVQPPIPGS